MKRFNTRNRPATFMLAVTIVFVAGIFAGKLLTAGDGSSMATINAGGLFPQAFAQKPELEGLPDVVEKVVPAVVNISSKRVVKIDPRSMHPFMRDPFFRRFFGMPDNLEQEQTSLGSGVIVSKDGYILTNNHLVEKAREVEVILPDDRRFDAEIVGSDPRSDVAVIKIDAEDLPSVPFGDTSRLRLGQVVLAIGYPYQVGQTVTMGIISALGRGGLQLVDYENFIQTDAAINPGNSGGALINSSGDLIGINTAILSRSGGSQGIGFAIPIDLARNIMEKIIKHGRVVRGWLGVSIQEVNEELAEAFDLSEVKGILVSDVEAGSPAEKGGLEPDDVIVAIQGKEVVGIREFTRDIAITEPGDRIDIEVLRNGKTRKLRVTIGERPDDVKMVQGPGESALSPLFVGVAFETLTDEHRRRLRLPARLSGVVITDVDGGSIAAEAGFERFDVITSVERTPVSDYTEFKRAIERIEDSRVLLRFFRDGRHYYLVLRK